MAHSDQEQKNTENKSPSLKGKGWEILVGGKENPFAKGGDDPFDIGTGPVKAGDSSKNPFADEDVDSLLENLAEDLDKVPEDAFWDRGRGSEAPEPAEKPDAPAEMPPRDLKPEDLGKLPYVDTSMADAHPAPIEITVPEPPQPVNDTPLSDSDLADLLKEPESLSDEEIDRRMAALKLQQSPPAVKVTEVVAQSFEISDPFIPETPPITAARPSLTPDTTMEKMLITPERINELWDAINETYDFVVSDVRGHFKTSEEAMADLKQARDLLLSGSENFDDAEQLVVKVKARLRLEEKVRQWSRTHGTWLGIYLILWFALLLMGTGVTLASGVIEQLADRVPEWLLGAWIPMLFGGLGATIGALWVLNKHIIKKRDFDPIHTSWYVTNPFMGLMLGIITYLVLRVGSAGLINLSGISAEPDFTSPSLVLYVICMIVGFQQNVLWSFMDKLMNLLIPNDHNEPATSKTEDNPVS